MRPTVASLLPCNAFPASRIAVRNPDRSIAAACSIVSVLGTGGLGNGGTGVTTPPSLQATFAGTINVAMRPGAMRAAMIASAASLPVSEAEQEVRNHFE